MNTNARFLAATGVLPQDVADEFMSPEGRNVPRAQMWDVVGEIIAKADSFKFRENYVGMEIVPAAVSVIATDGDESVVTPQMSRPLVF